MRKDLESPRSSSLPSEFSKPYKHSTKMVMCTLVCTCSPSDIISQFATLKNTDRYLDVKPDNILVNFGSATHRLKDVELGDCGDVYLLNPEDNLKIGEERHAIGAPMFSSPEVMLRMRWGPATDIWSFGTTVSPFETTPQQFAAPIID
jgi:hypothetical protein